MGRQLGNFLDIALLVVMLAISALFVCTSVPLIVGTNANLAQDKVVAGAGSVSFDEVHYTVSDLLLSGVNLDRSSPIREWHVRYDTGEYSLLDFDDNEYFKDTFVVAREVMKFKPESMTNKAFYELPITYYGEKANNGDLCYFFTIGG